jgi:CHAT domain-containing protein/tetratricopeptide (TPR) repeat protein
MTGMFALIALLAGPPGPTADVKAHLDRLHRAFLMALRGRAAEELVGAEKAYAAVREATGERHALHAEALGLLACIHEARGANAVALPLRAGQEKLLRDLGGSDWPPRLKSAERLAVTLRRLGRARESEKLLRELLAIAPARGSYDRDHARLLNSLGLAVLNQGRIEEAALVFDRAIDLGDAIDGSNNASIAYDLLGDYRKALRRAYLAGMGYEGLAVLPEYRSALGLHRANQGGLLHRMGDLEEAERELKRALEVFVGLLAKHPNHPTALNNLAHLHLTQGKPRDAIPLLEKALELTEAGTPGEPVFRHNLGRAHLMLGRLEEAEEQIERAQRLRILLGMDAHPQYGHGLLLLASLASKRGRLANCLNFAEQATWVYRRSAPGFLSQSLRIEAEVYLARGDLAQAARRAIPALRSALADLARAAENLPERQQLARAEAFRAHLDLCLSLGGTVAYPQVLASKGVVLDRQRRAREAARHSRDPRVRALAIKLDEATRRMAATQGPTTFLNTVRQVEQLERDLASWLPDVASSKPVTPEAVISRLPRDSALIDIIVYNHISSLTRGDRRAQATPSIAAFVLRPGHSILRVDLGDADEVDKAVNAWREEVSKSGSPTRANSRLSDLLLRPIRPHLKGVKTLLISPDGPSARIPWGALPGTKPGSYLLEEMAIAVVPVPRLIPEKPISAAAEMALLVVGDVDFNDSLPSRSAGHASAWRSGAGKWTELPATRGEAADVAAGFRATLGGAVSTLRGKQATEENVRSRLPGRTHVHFATHGYFSPGKDTARGMAPGLMSGLVLAGANREVLEGDDGILTASEVSEMDLRSCRLAVLSACETGLGPSAGGEGLLGLQRAFQVAGARSTVASLWKVPDAATAVLMERFYANLWRKGMNSTEALREAQLFLLNHGRRHPDVVRGMTSASGTTTLKAADGRVPPLFWAAWVLSGEWR